MPVNAIAYCLKEAKITSKDIDIVVFYDNPLLTFDRYVKNILAAGKDSKEIIERNFESMLGTKILIHKVSDEILGENEARKFYVCEHHASAFYSSPYEKAVIITLDGVGEWAITTIGIGNRKDIDIKEELHFPHSLGSMHVRKLCR